jgi:hypothetical protein
MRVARGRVLFDEIPKSSVGGEIVGGDEADAETVAFSRGDGELGGVEGVGGSAGLEGQE